MQTYERELSQADLDPHGWDGDIEDEQALEEAAEEWFNEHYDELTPTAIHSDEIGLQAVEVVVAANASREVV